MEKPMKLLGCVCLIAGTAIGAGMLALPITLAKFGLLISSMLMIGTWGICYFSSLLNLELNLRAGKGLPLGALGSHFSGQKSYLAGSISLLLLCYSLLCAYIYGGASTLVSIDNFPLSLAQTICVYAIGAGLVMLCSLQKVDILNRFLFLGKISITAVILVAVLWQLDFSNLPIASQTVLSFKDINLALPIVFTSFGFQVVFHTLTNYTNKDPIMLKRAFFWGSLVPAVAYILWITVVCAVIYHNNTALFEKMVFSGVEVGEILQALCHISGSSMMRHMTWAIGFFAVLTATIGVSLGLIDALKTKHVLLSNHTVAVVAAVVPALCIALLVPNAFIKALSFAGMILSFMALLLPMYLLYCANRMKKKPIYWYPILKNPFILFLIVGYGVCVIVSELLNLFAG
jgi:tyrosine-specific transport protein